MISHTARHHGRFVWSARDVSSSDCRQTISSVDQLRKLTLSFSELRYLVVEHNEKQVRAAVEALPKPNISGQSGDILVIVQVPNLAILPIYRIAPEGRDLGKRQKSEGVVHGPPSTR